MIFYPEGTKKNVDVFTPENLQSAYEKGTILESRALMCDKDKQLRFMLGRRPAVMPLQECMAGGCKEVAVLARVGHMVSFMITEIPADTTLPVVLSRARAQDMCKAECLDNLQCGEVIACKVTHLESFGAFCDVGCGVAALLPIDCLSISRISHPSDRVCVGQQLRCIVKSRDDLGRLVLSLKELLGTWQENAAHFNAGETVVGIVRSIEKYGVFIELAPNLSGLAEYSEALRAGQLVSVYIKSILPEKRKIKLAILRTIEGEDFRFPITYYTQDKMLTDWHYV